MVKNTHNAKIEALKKQAFIILSNINSNMKKLNASLIAALSDEERIDAEIEAFLSSVDYTALKCTQEFIDVKELLKQIMELVAQELYFPDAIRSSLYSLTFAKPASLSTGV